MASAKYNKVKCAKFELDIAKYLRSLGHFVERLAKAGSKDEGDLVAIIAGQTYILELKNRKKIDLPAFWDEAQVETKNYAKSRGLEQTPPAYVIVKRRNHPVSKAWVVQDLESWLAMPTPQGDITTTEINKPEEKKEEEKK